MISRGEGVPPLRREAILASPCRGVLRFATRGTRVIVVGGMPMPRCSPSWARGPCYVVSRAGRPWDARAGCPRHEQTSLPVPPRRKLKRWLHSKRSKQIRQSKNVATARAQLLFVPEDRKTCEKLVSRTRHLSPSCVSFGYHGFGCGRRPRCGLCALGAR